MILTDAGSSLIRTQGIKTNSFEEFVTNKSIISLKQACNAYGLPPVFESLSAAFRCTGVHPLKGFVQAQGKLAGIWKEFHLDFLHGKFLAVFTYDFK